ncbi:MAG: L-alanine-DL-glutamate epimerase [Firmicutes bacterium]|nr:L-alanine-DL-glutamate epimerase [Bacillota bacterium]
MFEKTCIGRSVKAMIKIKRTNSNFVREPLLAPFGFKGGYVDELWQVAAFMESESGHRSIGLGVQSILWSDAQVFACNSQAAGNSMMFLITEYALRKAMELEFDTPVDLFEQLLPITYEYGKKITNNDNLRMTFVLNALVALDNAAWLLYCRENGINSFDDMVPQEYRTALSFRHEKLASIPLITYGVSVDEIKSIISDGYFFLKVKIGSDPNKDGDREKMLEWDKKRLYEIHSIVKDVEIPYTTNGKIPYYLDANGRYDNKERLMKLLDYADKIGALERIILLEEPFPEEYKVDVTDIPVRLAADESAHSDKDALERIELGYRAIALKPIAKTMSMSLKIAKIAHEKGIPCFCADLTVNPVMVDWNKNVAARLAPLPGMKIGVLESNGHQNYARWQKMKEYHPCYGKKWIETDRGLYNLDDNFYSLSGGILEKSDYYESLVRG